MKVDIPKGKIFNLAFPVTIKKGDWYWGVKCKGCTKPILAFNDGSKGQHPGAFTGEGKIRVPCQACGHEEYYVAADLRSFKAQFSAKSYKDRRRQPSGSGRQPFLPKYANAKVTFGMGALEQRPEAAIIIARCIAYWTVVETSAAGLLATMLKANTEPAVAVYLSLQNNRAKRDVMFAAAEASLNPGDLRLFEALMSYKQAVEKERNSLAHGIFGLSYTIKEGVVW